METWYRMPSGKVRHSSGQLKDITEIQDQIDDERISLIDWIGSDEQLAEELTQKENSEREWRDSELEAADNKVRDNDDRGNGQVKKAWQDYRIELRDYPQQPDFPNGTRPLKPE